MGARKRWSTSGIGNNFHPQKILSLGQIAALERSHNECSIRFKRTTEEIITTIAVAPKQ